MLCGLALVDAARGVSGVPVVLKWPNDLIVEGDERRWRKVAGLLSEVGGAPDFLVVGVGLNVNVPRAQLPHLAPNATSLMAETGRQVSRVALLDAFLRGVEEGYERLRAGWDPLAEWEGALAWLGREVEVHTPTGSRRGIALGVDDGGALVLRLAEGQARSFPAGDVSLRTAQRVGVGS
jgi:BirA family biotin operon repressor/biotin-[acetyl-CoA-carboxylase] ligase